jgi:hypothetical protein
VAQISPEFKPHTKKKKKDSRAGDVAQVIECLLSKLKALRSNPVLLPPKKNGFKRNFELEVICQDKNV